MRRMRRRARPHYDVITSLIHSNNSYIYISFSGGGGLQIQIYVHHSHIYIENNSSAPQRHIKHLYMLILTLRRKQKSSEIMRVYVRIQTSMMRG